MLYVLGGVRRECGLLIVYCVLIVGAPSVSCFGGLFCFELWFEVFFRGFDYALHCFNSLCLPALEW